MGAKATYVYCAVQARRQPSFRRMPAGPPGLGPHRFLDAGRDLWLVVADAPLSRYGEEPIRRGLHDMKWLSRCAVGHEAVIEYCLRARAVVPMKLFTIFENDFRATKEIERQRHEHRRIDEARGRTPRMGCPHPGGSCSRARVPEPRGQAGRRCGNGHVVPGREETGPRRNARDRGSRSDPREPGLLDAGRAVG